MFDPNMEVEEEVKVAEDNAPMEAPVEKGDKEINDKLKSSFGTMDIKDLKEFMEGSESPSKGEYKFTVEQGHFKEAVTAVRMTSSMKSNPNPVRLTLGKDTLRVSTFNPFSFAEYIIPLVQPSGLKDGKSVRFIFDYNVLSRIATIFTEDVLELDVLPEKRLCKITAGKTNLEITTYPDSDFADFSGKMESMKMKSKIDPDSIRKAIQFIYPFTVKNDLQPNFSLVEIRDGQAIGGTPFSIVTMTSKHFEGISLKMRYEFLVGMEKTLQFFDAKNTYLFESDDYYIIRDGNTMCGFEKTPYQFLNITPIVSAVKTDKRLMVPRDVLQNTLQKLSVVSIDKKLPVTMSYRIGKGESTSMTLMTEDATGKQSKDTIPMTAKGYEPDDTEHSFKVTLSSLLRTVSFHDSHNIELLEVPGKAVFLEDKYEEDTYLTVLSLLQ